MHLLSLIIDECGRFAHVIIYLFNVVIKPAVTQKITK